MSAFLKEYFAEWVDYGFSSSMEDQLDLVCAGQQDQLSLLTNFWLKLVADVGAIQDVPVVEVCAGLYHIVKATLLAHALAGTSVANGPP